MTNIGVKSRLNITTRMPTRPATHKPKGQPGRAEHRKQIDKYRGSSTQRGYDYQWQQARKRYLSEHPLCVECSKTKRVEAATVVDHIKPHHGDQALFWNELNWQALCKRCHDRKTAVMDGGFGNAVGGGG